MGQDNSYIRFLITHNSTDGLRQLMSDPCAFNSFRDCSIWCDNCDGNIEGLSGADDPCPLLRTKNFLYLRVR